MECKWQIQNVFYHVLLVHLNLPFSSLYVGYLSQVTDGSVVIWLLGLVLFGFEQIFTIAAVEKKEEETNGKKTEKTENIQFPCKNFSDNYMIWSYKTVCKYLLFVI